MPAYNIRNSDSLVKIGWLIYFLKIKIETQALI